MNELRALAAVFRSPDLRRLELAWLATSIGTWGAALVLAVYAFREGGATAVGIMALARTLPGVPLAPLLTYVADRVSRRAVLLASNVARAGALAGIAASIMFEVPLGIVYLGVGLFAAASPAYRPSQAALFPVLARTPAELSSVNAAATLLTNAGFLVGSVAGGLLLTVVDAPTVLFVLAAIFAMSLAPLWRISPDVPPPPDPDARPLGDLMEGLRTITGDPELRVPVAITGVAMLTLGGADVLLIVASLDLLDIGESGAGWLSAVLGVGGLAGGFAVLPLLGRRRLATALLLGALMFGVPLILVGLVPTLTVVAIALLVAGAGEAFADVAASTLLQRLAPEHVLSRVFGVVEAQSVAAIALGSVAAGLIADLVSPQAAFAIVGALLPTSVLLARSRLARYEAGAPVPEREYALLRAHPIFAPLPVATTEQLARSARRVQPRRGDWIVREGDPGDCLYMVATGDLDVYTNRVPTGTVGAGDAFGEIALLRDAPRAASVRARDGVSLLVVDRDVFVAAVTGIGHSQRAAASIADARLATKPAVDSWVDAVKDAERRGELLAAVDLAEQGLLEFPDELPLRYRSVLALARAGATHEAAARYARHGLLDIFDEDVAALGARIAKDVALAAQGDRRRSLAGEARDAYGAIYERTGGYYPAINAATLSLVAGDHGRARVLSTAVLGHVAGDDSYYGRATAGEAHLLLGNVAAARAALVAAADRVDGDHGALATTRRQLALVVDLLGIDPGVLAALVGPTVVHFAGHRIAAPGKPGRFPAEKESAVGVGIAAAVAALRPRYAYGALAAGADIMWAEALIEAGAELHIVLPFAREAFIERSVAPSGPDWVRRFERCFAAAEDVTYATDDAYLGDDILFRYGGELAMGMTLLRARYLAAEAHQLAVWDGEPALGDAGTAIDIATWHRRGLPLTTVDLAGAALDVGIRKPPHPVAPRGGREVRAMLFGDVKGFSKLTDEQLPPFAATVLAAFSSTLARFAPGVLSRNTWGDALFVVLDGTREAAECALTLQEAMGMIDLPAAGLPESMALRLGAHVGPVYSVVDPVLGMRTFLGSHVSRTARIEPVTPAGEVYVTAAFAAALELAGAPEFRCDYVGHMPAAKDYGNLRMYRLRRSTV